MADTAALIETYRRAQQRIIKAILSSKSVAFNAGMLRTINAELARLQGKTVRWVESQIPEAYREGMRSVNSAYEKAYKAAGEVGPKSYPTEFSKINRRAIQLLVDNTKSDFDNALGFVGRQIKDDLRQANLQAIADKISSGTTIDKTRKILAEKYASQGLAAIKYKRGGRDAFMSLDAYAGLVARSTTAEATNTACQKQVEEFGDDLVQMTTHANACPICVSLEGRVYSISGKHPDYPALDLAYSDGYANIHPNCGHRLVPYIADLKTPEEIAEDKRISGRSFDIEKWSPAERAQAESNLKAYKLGQAKKRAIYTDRRQWERYKAELGPDAAPKSLSGFRSMKKADSDKWKELRGQYRSSVAANRPPVQKAAAPIKAPSRWTDVQKRMIGESNLKEWRDPVLPNKYSPTDARWGTEAGEYTVYRTGNLERKIIFTGNTEDSVAWYAEAFPEQDFAERIAVKSYTANITNPYVSRDMPSAYEALFGSRPDLYGTKKLTTGDLWVRADNKITAELKRRGYDAWTMTSPAPPADKEMILFNQKSLTLTGRKIPDRVATRWLEEADKGGFFANSYVDGKSTMDIREWFLTDAYKAGKAAGLWR
jgi:hypothetical protein